VTINGNGDKVEQITLLEQDEQQEQMDPIKELDRKASGELQNRKIGVWEAAVESSFNQLVRRIKPNERKKFAERVFGVENHRDIALFVDDGERDHLYQHLKTRKVEYTVQNFVHDASDVGIDQDILIAFINSIKDI